MLDDTIVLDARPARDYPLQHIGADRHWRTDRAWQSRAEAGGQAGIGFVAGAQSAIAVGQKGRRPEIERPQKTAERIRAAPDLGEGIACADFTRLKRGHLATSMTARPMLCQASEPTLLSASRYCELRRQRLSTRSASRALVLSNNSNGSTCALASSPRSAALRVSS